MIEVGKTVELTEPEENRRSVYVVHERNNYPGSGEGVVKTKGALLTQKENSVTAAIKPLVFKRPIRVNAFLGEFDEDGNYLFNLAYYRVWNELRETPLHSIPQIWLAPNNFIAMTDLSAIEGGSFYGRAEYNQLMQKEYSRQPEDLIFQKIPLAEIERQARKVIKIATDLKIRLNEDPLNMFVKPDGSFKIIPLDIGETIFNVPDPYADNVSGFHQFIKYISTLQKDIG